MNIRIKLKNINFTVEQRQNGGWRWSRKFLIHFLAFWFIRKLFLSFSLIRKKAATSTSLDAFKCSKDGSWKRENMENAPQMHQSFDLWSAREPGHLSGTQRRGFTGSSMWELSFDKLMKNMEHRDLLTLLTFIEIFFWAEIKFWIDQEIKRIKSRRKQLNGGSIDINKCFLIFLFAHQLELVF